MSRFVNLRLIVSFSVLWQVNRQWYSQIRTATENNFTIDHFLTPRTSVLFSFWLIFMNFFGQFDFISFDVWKLQLFSSSNLCLVMKKDFWAEKLLNQVSFE